jgi:hypothetical protein
MAEPILREPRSRALGDIIAAALLVFGAAIENRRGRKRGGHRAWLAAVPIAGVNFVAFYGQFSYFQAHRHPIPGVTIPAAVSAVVATALESIAVYLAWQAHVARLKGDSAFRLRLGAYLTGLVIGALNYSHFCDLGWRPNAFAVAFGLASVISPALWGIHSNRESRDALKAQELIEDHAVRLGATRWFFHLYRSFRVMFRATWVGENRPAEAIKLIDPPKWARGKDSDPAPAAAGPPPSAPRKREPRPAEGDAARAARKPGLTAVPPVTLAALSEAERVIALGLMGTQPLPAVRKLAGDPRLPGSLATRRRHAGRILEAVRAGRNGGGHRGVDDGS